MNIVRIPRLLKNSTLLLAALGSSLLLTACGGDSNKSTSTSSSSSSSTSSHAFSSTPVTPPLSGTWPDVKVSASGTKTLKFDWTAAPGATFYKLLKKADSNSNYVQVGSDFTGTTITDPVSVHLTDWVNSRYKVQACNSNGCQDSTVVVADSAMNTAITYMKASNTETNDWFGWSIAISGDGKTMAVGAPAEASNAKGVNGDQTSNTSPTSGAVYVFAKVNGNWQQEAFLKASNTEQPGDGVSTPIPLPNARFGYQVALSSDGNTLAVSAINEDSVSVGVNCDPHNVTYSSSVSNSSISQGYVTGTVATDIGAVYIFKRANTQWNQTGYIKPRFAYFFGMAELSFGYSLALSGDGSTLAVGTSVDSSGAAGISTNVANSSSSTTGCINFSSTSSSSTSSSLSSSSSSSSSSVSSSGSSIIGGANSGAVYTYKLKDNVWTEDAYIKASDAYPGDGFGTSVALSFNGDTLAVGAIGAEEMVTNSSSSSIKATVTVSVNGTDFQSTRNSGAVYIYRYSASWLEKNKIVPINQGWGQLFGAALALSNDGNTLAVGTPNDWSLSAGVGANVSPTNFTYEATLAFDSTYGYYIVPKFDTAREKSSYASGAAYIYKYSAATNNWVQDSYFKASNPQTGYQFGSSLALSGSGDVLAVGCYSEASLATSINGDQLDTSSLRSGAAYVFKRDASTWIQKSYVKAPNSNTEDRFARSLSLDFTGDILAIGAYREASKAFGINGDKADNSAAGAGAAYIY